MNAKAIVILMMVVIAVLFIWSARYRRKEKNTNALEIASFEAMKRWLEDRSEDNRERAIEAHAALAQAHGTPIEVARENAKLELERL